jgi:hypothetical protein
MRQIITLKSIVFGAVLSGALFSQKVVAQSGSVWVKIPSASSLAIQQTAGSISTNSVVLNELISDYSISAMYPAFPSSRNAELQQVYQLDCACDETDLLYAVSTLKGMMVSPELGPHYETLSTPNDFYLNFQNDYALNLIRAQNAWDITQGSSSIKIAITDSNFDFDHEEFVGKLVYADTTLTNSNVAHGTAVAITAAGRTNNNAGKSSIGFNSMLQLRGMSYNEMLNATYSGAKIVNASWVSGCTFSTYGQQVVNEVFNNGTLIVASAGNGSTCNNASNLVYPASFENVLSVTSIGPNDNHERFVGNTASTHQHNAMVDLSAPGYDVAISTASGVYISGTGSSYAAAFVSGAAALVLSVKPCLSVTDLVQILKLSTDTINTINPQYTGLIGTGRLNVEAAIQLALTYSTLVVESTVVRECGNATQTIAVNPLSGDAPYSVVWADGSTNLNYQTLTAGNYIFTVTDANGCNTTENVTVAPFTPMSYDAVVTQVTCNGTQNGGINLSVMGGLGEYTYGWSNGSITNEITGLGAGIYEVNITDSMGCTQPVSFELVEPTVLNVSLIQTNVIDGNSGMIDLTVNGGTANYTYSWNNDATSEDLFNLSVGYYEVTVLDANNCSVVVGATISSSVTVIGHTDLVDNSIADNLATINEEQSLDFEINVYPNPATDAAIVSWKGIEVDKMHIQNMNGQIVYEQVATTNQINVNVTDLSAGVYVVVLETSANQHIPKRLIVN